MKYISNLVKSIALVAGLVGCTRDYSFLEHKDVSQDNINRYDAGADRRGVVSDTDAKIKYDGPDVYSLDAQVDALARDLGRDANVGIDSRVDAQRRYDGETRIDGRVDAPADGYSADARADSQRRYDDGETRIDGRADAPVDGYSADAQRRYDGETRIDGRIIIFPDAGISDAYADGTGDMPVDLGADLSPDVGADTTVNPCPGTAPLNSLQAGVCAGSRNSCDPTGWQDDYSVVAGYEVNEVSCDGLNNDCIGGVDDTLVPESRECFDGIGECRRSGLEYKTCLGSAGWSTDYSGCDAVAGSPVPEVCDGRDNDCDGLVDILEIIDDFNRPDQVGLGNNALGNLWVNDGSLANWSILGDAAVTSWIGGAGTNPRVSSDIEHRATFHNYIKFNLSEVDYRAGGALMYSINSSISNLDGFNIRICELGASNHRLSYGGETIVGIQTLFANRDYILKLDYNGATFGAKIWEEGTPEPAGYLISIAVTNVDISKRYLTLTGDLNGGQSLTTTIDYIAEGCE